MHMPEFFSTLINVLELEKKKNFQDKAVAGGFINFTKFIQNRDQKIERMDALSHILQVIFESYQFYSPELREIVINKLIEAFKNNPENIANIIAEIKSLLPEKENSTFVLQPKQDKTLYADIQSIRGIGERNSRKFQKLGLNNIYDILRFFPRRYQDYSNLKTINQIIFGEDLSIIGTITKSPQMRPSKSGKIKIIESAISDATGSLRLTWFNKPFLTNQIKQGMSIIVSGKVDVYLGRLVINNPDWELLDSAQLNTNRIVPIYPLTSGITQRQIRNITNGCLNIWNYRIKEYLPSELVLQEKLAGIQEAIRQIHFPDSDTALDASRERFAFEEIFFLQLGVFVQKKEWESKKGKVFFLSSDFISNKISALPYKLTDGQTQALNEIQQDLKSGKPMNRLLQGDVGSGKTVVARFAIEIVVNNQSQAAVMAPTAILAEQHYQTFRDMFINSGSLKEDEIALLIGSTPKKVRKTILEGLESGVIKVIIGTHALIEEPVIFRDLELAVIDEQHRFGVSQRAMLRQKGESPHLLVMTATPIPRSLALTIYGDLEISTITEMPIGRRPVETGICQPQDRETAYSLISSQIIKGFQAFIIYPLIETDENEDYLSVVNEYERISKKIFPMFSVGLLHGKLKPAVKDKIMKDFRDQKYQILLSTTVVEVGVDIPNATVVLIEGANRFGLAQLHQIRGRVGRSDHQSYCILIPDDDNAAENERLVAMTKTNDGFKLADFDLQQRGPGEFLGSRQSGYVGLRFASVTDIKLIERSRRHALKIIKTDPQLKKPEHQLLMSELTYHWPELQLDK